jgi:methionyl aminopeptidase
VPKQVLRIELKTLDQIQLMRQAGLVVARTLTAVRDAVAPGVSTGELDELAEATIRSEGAVPSFKGYHGYPASICTSVNEQVVHAIPSRSIVLRDGDIISIDCGAVRDGWHGDAAITVPVGAVRPAVRRLIDATETALWAGIAAAVRGVRNRRGRLTDISHAVQSSIQRASGRYGIVEGYGGHGIGSEMHEDPFVHNVGRPGMGPALVPGVVLAIEPMVTLGRPRVAELDDGWTVVTADGSVAAHAEHTVALCQDGAWVLTDPDGGIGRLGALVSEHARRSDTPDSGYGGPGLPMTTTRA